MTALNYIFFGFLTIITTVSGVPSGTGISQVGMNIYKDAAEYHAARAQRHQLLQQQREQQPITYTVQHPRNPNQAVQSHQQPTWRQPQVNYRQQPTQQTYRQPIIQTQQPAAQAQHSNRYFRNTPTPKPFDYIDAKFQVLRNQHRFNPNTRFSSNTNWLRAREATEEMRKNLNLIEALDPSQPLKYY